MGRQCLPQRIESRLIPSHKEPAMRPFAAKVYAPGGILVGFVVRRSNGVDAFNIAGTESWWFPAMAEAVAFLRGRA